MVLYLISILLFLSENKSSLITKVELELVHESNEKISFSWTWFEESLFQMDLPKIPIGYKKNQKAIALNVNESILVEKRIGFQSIKFKEEVEKLTKIINEDSLNLKNSGKELSELKSHSSFNNIIDFAQNSFIWKIGTYEAKFKVYLAESNKIFDNIVKFQLSNLDIKTLYKNIDTCKTFVEKAFIKINEELNEKWEWITVNSLSDTEIIRIFHQKK